MKIDVSGMKEIYKRQKKRDEKEKGVQPEMVFGCFLALKRENTEYCEQCGYYSQTCRLYLEGFEIKEKMFGRWDETRI